MSTADGGSIGTHFSLCFPDISGREANSFASSLTEKLRDIDASVAVSRDKSNPDTQDMGAILNIVLGSAPAAAIATGLAAWIRIKRVKVRIMTDDRSIDVSGDGPDVAKIIGSVFSQK